jgi:hypothetical protein
VLAEAVSPDSMAYQKAAALGLFRSRVRVLVLVLDAGGALEGSMKVDLQQSLSNREQEGKDSSVNL